MTTLTHGPFTATEIGCDPAICGDAERHAWLHVTSDVHPTLDLAVSMHEAEHLIGLLSEWMNT